MKWMLTLVASLVVGQGTALAERAATPADATVFIRLVGSVHAELEEAGAAKQIVDLDRIEIGTGSGFVISPHGYVLTNEHVISNSEFAATDGPRKAKFTLKIARIDVCFPPASASARGALTRCFEASVHSSDAALDLAVLFITASDLPYVALGDSDVLRSGQGVEALGYPFGRGLEVGRVAAPDLVPEISISAGTISALRADDNGDRRVLQINSTVNPGNSGGPVVDREGYAVGVIRARVKGDAGIGFAIPINQAKDFLESRGLDSLMPARALAGWERCRFSKGRASPCGCRRVSSRHIAIPIARRERPGRGRRCVADRSRGLAMDRDADRAHTCCRPRRSNVSRSRSERKPDSVARAAARRLLVGPCDWDGCSAATAEIRMQYGILDLGAEKLIARYVGSAEHLAYNESVLRGSLLSLDGQRLMSGDGSVECSTVVASARRCRSAVPQAGLSSLVRHRRVPRFRQRVAVMAAYPARDVDARTRAAALGRRGGSPQQAAAACSSRRGSWRTRLYALRAEWLGVSYAIEGVFVRVGSRLVVQLEVISPEQKRRRWLALCLQTGSKRTSRGAQMTRAVMLRRSSSL